VIGFVIRQVDLEQVQPAVDDLGESELAYQEVHGADAAVADPPTPLAAMRKCSTCS
jgi:hypothetical protein